MCVCASLVCLHLHVLLCYHNGIGLEKISKSFNLCERLIPDKVYICKSQAICYVQITHVMLCTDHTCHAMYVQITHVMLRMYRSHMSCYVCTDHTCRATYVQITHVMLCTDHTCHAMYRSHVLVYNSYTSWSVHYLHAARTPLALHCTLCTWINVGVTHLGFDLLPSPFSFPGGPPVGVGPEQLCIIGHG